jgi:hypothetical protein
MMLFHLKSKNIGVKFFESLVLLANARYSHGPSLKMFLMRAVERFFVLIV